MSVTSEIKLSLEPIPTPLSIMILLRKSNLKIELRKEYEELREFLRKELYNYDGSRLCINPQKKHYNPIVLDLIFMEFADVGWSITEAKFTDEWYIDKHEIPDGDF